LIEIDEGAILVVWVQAVFQHVCDEFVDCGHWIDLVETGLVMDSHAENDCTVGDVAMMFSTRDVTVV